MPWCLKCRMEYREGFERCSDCGSKLVRELEIEPENADFDHEVFLINVKGEIEARIIESKLGVYEIPVMRKYTGASAYVSIYAGNTMFGIDLYVPSRALDVARDIIRNKDTDTNTNADIDINANANADTSMNTNDNIDTGTEININSNSKNNTVMRDNTEYYTESSNKDAKMEWNEDVKKVQAQERTLKVWKAWILLLLFAPGIIGLILILLRKLYDYIEPIK